MITQLSPLCLQVVSSQNGDDPAGQSDTPITPRDRDRVEVKSMSETK